MAFIIKLGFVAWVVLCCSTPFPTLALLFASLGDAEFAYPNGATRRNEHITSSRNT
jgi:hypothetical protein